MLKAKAMFIPFLNGFSKPKDNLSPAFNFTILVITLIFMLQLIFYFKAKKLSTEPTFTNNKQYFLQAWYTTILIYIFLLSFRISPSQETYSSLTHWHLITPDHLEPTAKEISDNPRSRSASLWAAEKKTPTAANEMDKETTAIDNKASRNNRKRRQLKK